MLIKQFDTCTCTYCVYPYMYMYGLPYSMTNFD